MKCASCLSTVNEDESICPYCGHKFIEKSYIDTNQSSNIPPITHQEEKNQDAYSLLKSGIEAMQNDPQKAMDSLYMAIRKQPDLAEAHNGLGFIYMSHNDLEQAESYFHKALSLKPKMALFHYNLACLYLRKHIHEQAIFHVQKSLEIQPDFPLAKQLEQYCQTLTPEFLSRYRNGEDLVRNHKSDHAIAHFTDLLNEFPDHAPSQALLGQAYAMSSQLQEAIYWLEKSTSLDPLPQNYQQLSMMYIHNSQPEKAIEILKIALEKRADYSDLHFSLGIAYESIGDYELSLNGFETALAFNPQDTKVFFKMALLHEKHGQVSAAIEALEHLLQFEPESPLARAKLLQLKAS